MACTICFDKFTASLRKCTTCAYCDASVCRICLQQYLLVDTATEANCPSCRKSWDRDFLNDNLTASFRNGPFKKHREKVLMDRERARFPDTQNYAIVYKNAKEHYDSVCQEAEAIRLTMKKACKDERKTMNMAARTYNELLHTVRKELMPNPVPPGFVYHTWYNQVTPQVVANPEIQSSYALYTQADKVLNDKMAPYLQRLRPIEQMMYDYRHAINTYGLARGVAGAVLTDEQKAPRAVFHQKCPAEDCEGFLSTQWKCGLCNGKFCKDCHESKADDHECNPDLAASVKAIKKEAKPCPKCASQISKIDGCDQMWCTQCHTAFSWNTGRIETHVVHNPHYFQWMRENGGIMPRAPGDNPDPNAACGGINRLITRLRAISPKVANIEGYTEFVNHMLENIRAFQHYTQVDIQKYQDILNADTQENDRRVLRVKRMLNEITDDDWKTTLQRKEKEQLRTQARRQLLDMYATAGMEIIGQVFNEDYDAKSICKQLSALYKFTDKSNSKIAKAYSCTRLKIVMRTNTINVQFTQYD
jgi:hypothetical protein